jgi:hypothetical protein
MYAEPELEKYWILLNLFSACFHYHLACADFLEGWGIVKDSNYIEEHLIFIYF